MSFKIEVGKHFDYWADASLDEPDSARQTNVWTLAMAGTFTVGVVSTTSANVKSGFALGVNTSTNDSVSFYSLQKSWVGEKVNKDTGYTIEAQIKIITSGSTSGNAIRFRDGENSEELLIKAANFTLLRSNITHTVDTTDDFHKYRITVKGNITRVYFDEILVLAGSSPLASAQKDVIWGDNSDAANRGGHAQWSYFRYNLDGAFPPNADTQEGWVFDKFDVVDRRRIAKHPIIRSDRSIIPEGKMNPARLRLSGTIVGSEWLSLRESVRGLKRMLNSGTQKIAVDDERTIEGLSTGFNFNMIKNDFAKFSNTFECRNPFWVENWASYFTTAPASQGTFPIINDSDVDIPLKIIITGAASGTAIDFSIDNLNTGQVMKFVGALQQTQELLVDSGFDTYNTFAVKIGTASVFGSYEGDMLVLAPGVNQLIYKTGTGLIGTLEFYWREATQL